MGYPQKLLGADEEIEFEMRPHWRSLIVPSLVLIGSVAVASFLLSTFNNDSVQWIVIISALVAVIGWALRPFLVWLTTQYVFTNRRIIVRSGLLSRAGRDMPLARVNNVTFDKTLIERMLNCGTLTVQSAAERGTLVIASVPNIEEIQREVYRLYEADDVRRRNSGPGQAPSDGT